MYLVLTFCLLFLTILPHEIFSQCPAPHEEVITHVPPSGPHYTQKFYRWGQRYKGDVLLAETTRKFASGKPQRIQTEFIYPRQEFFTTITFVQVESNQAKTQGKAFCIEGGLGMNYVTVAVEAEGTKFLNASFSVFGFIIKLQK